MIEGWSLRHAWRVRGHVRRLRRSKSTTPAMRHAEELALSTGLLAMYSDIGGSILLSATGKVYFLDHSTDGVGPLRDPFWIKVALARLAERFPDLADLRPRRPEGAIDCRACRGQGRTPTWNLPCGDCAGAGWVVG